MRDHDQFRDAVWEFYGHNGRHDLVWRIPESDGSLSPYKIMVSELMLQQTQAARVAAKYQEFLDAFPTVESLATASLGDVLRVWTGLGYNRRAKFLHQAAQHIVYDLEGIFPDDESRLVSLPGVGVNTAGAIMAYAHNKPVTFIETNIRTVYIHHFFQDSSEVADAQLRPYITATVDLEQPREWYWALMDYGSHLKKVVGNLNKLSNTYAKQSTFDGSRRQVRGEVIRLLSSEPYALARIVQKIPDERTSSVLEELVAEGMIRLQDDQYVL